MISRFIGEYSFLDLDYPMSYTLYDVHFKTLKHYFYSFKCQAIWGMRKVATSTNPEKTLEKYCAEYKDFTRSDWETVRYDILSHGVYIRFYSDYGLQKKLLDTEDQELIYGLLDTDLSEDQLFLGYSLINHSGYNALGKLLTYYRDYFKSIIENLQIDTYIYPEMSDS